MHWKCCSFIMMCCFSLITFTILNYCRMPSQYFISIASHQIILRLLYQTSISQLSSQTLSKTYNQFTSQSVFWRFIQKTIWRFVPDSSVYSCTVKMSFFPRTLTKRWQIWKLYAFMQVFSHQNEFAYAKQEHFHYSSSWIG